MNHGIPSVTDGRPQRVQTGRKGKAEPGSGGPVPPRRDWNHKVVISPPEGAGAEGSRPLRGIFISFSESLPIPADASGAYRPNPQATKKLAVGHP